MKVLIRTDTSKNIGTGHLVRCLTLAQDLEKAGHKITFLSRDDKEGLAGHFLSGREGTIWLPDDEDMWSDAFQANDLEKLPGGLENAPHYDWCIVDHYGLSRRWESAVRQYADNVAVIDDLANRPHDCDIIIDQTYGRAPDDYNPLTPDDCKILTGAQYAILRPQFAAWRQRALSRRHENNGQIKRLLVSPGSTNLHNITGKVLQALGDYKDNALQVDVVLGSKAPYLEDVKTEIDSLNASYAHKARLLTDVSDMAALMAEADLAIGAGGTTSWERCCLGLPALIIEIADNQKKVAGELARAGAAINLGWHKDITSALIANTLDKLSNNPELMKSMTEKAAAVTNGRGTDYLLPCFAAPQTDKNGNPITLRFMKQSDAETVFTWQINPETRKHFRTPEPPQWPGHLEWMGSTLNNPDRYTYIIECNREAAGLIRLDRKQKPGTEEGFYEVSILVSPDFYRRGISSAALKLVRDLRPRDLFMAEVYPENEASVRLFTKAGYRQRDKTWYAQTPS